jgi:small-conductance mechanosensitive channel
VLAGFFLTLLRRRYWLEPGIEPKSGFWPVVRFVFAAIAIAAPLLSLAGYAALSRFAHSALVMTIALIGGALLLRAVLHEGLLLLRTPPRRGRAIWRFGPG